MDVFGLRNRVIEDYRGYVQSFLRIADPRIAEFVTRRLDEGALWPDPLVQLSPAYEDGPTGKGTGHLLMAKSLNYLMRYFKSWHRGRTAREGVEYETWSGAESG